MNSPKKSLGQHWLNDESILMAITQAGDVQAGDLVLEIGPGTGTLTAQLLNVGARVHAIEFDMSLIPALKGKFKTHKDFQVEPGDIRTYDFSKLEPGYKIVANIPYYLTSHLIRILSESSNPPTRAALLIQKEVAERVAARAGDMSLLSATSQLFWDVALDIVVPAQFFTPPPKVDSQVLVLTRPAIAKVQKLEPVLRVMKAGFSAPRKKLVNNLAAGLRIDKETAQQAMNSAELQPGLRAQDLSIDDWAKLTQALEKV